ncbi:MULTISPECIES: hypothetical protein [unclassified Siphonobacter]|uniref:hypothetical protein n=1 Tax=unclassified Siphonobacter TaxID=2635712 RepID=UPI00278701DF|nr:MULTISPECIES: hypothetical protein [unclassified Siphonobacter]MDQ1085514.1 putative membrane protein [Siphonobacter sp. SORGH_AS_1065]MDR6197273.1 putative membrane protein [Siphonobacter sp. SORGH_AS_0500]
MNIDELKNDWKSIKPENAGMKEQPMIKKGNNQLNAIRLRLVIEMVSYLVFLAVYYTMFDGDKKPLYANWLLIGSFLMVIIHSLMGYLAAKNIVSGESILQSMTNYHKKLKGYAMISLLTRTVSLICLLIFFVSSVELDIKKNWMLVGLVLLVATQAYINYKIWLARIKKIGDCIENWQS